MQCFLVTRVLSKVEVARSWIACPMTGSSCTILITEVLEFLAFLYAMDLIDVLKKKHASGSYKEMVMYIEACESGSIFEGIMPKDINIYVTTASNAEENSWGTYCPGMEPSPPPEYVTCLGDLYSVSWMEDSETHNLKAETIKQQYHLVKERTSNYNTFSTGSHVMRYGNESIEGEKLYLYQGFDPASVNFSPNNVHIGGRMDVVNQRDAELVFLWQMYKRSEDGSEKKTQILNQIKETVRHRTHLDSSVELIGTLLFGSKKGSAMLKSVREPGSPLVDDWTCLKSMVRRFETHCGSLTQYGMKHMRAFANICNGGVSQASMEEACFAACSGRHFGGTCIVQTKVTVLEMKEELEYVKVILLLYIMFGCFNYPSVVAFPCPGVPS
ncbi:hypothetical protein OIU78_013908 [Salix suchowensis]|nr:hypothetical protein OIU78_013908 [Salix suchowensis]